MIPGPTGPTVVGRQTLLAHPLSSTRPAQALAVGAQLGHTRSSTDCRPVVAVLPRTAAVAAAAHFMGE
jgi:hypothetical protein